MTAAVPTPATTPTHFPAHCSGWLRWPARVVASWWSWWRYEIVKTAPDDWAKYDHTIDDGKPGGCCGAVIPDAQPWAQEERECQCSRIHSHDGPHYVLLPDPCGFCYGLAAHNQDCTASDVTSDDMHWMTWRNDALHQNAARLLMAVKANEPSTVPNANQGDNS